VAWASNQQNWITFPGSHRPRRRDCRGLGVAVRLAPKAAQASGVTRQRGRRRDGGSRRLLSTRRPVARANGFPSDRPAVRRAVARLPDEKTSLCILPHNPQRRPVVVVVISRRLLWVGRLRCPANVVVIVAGE